MPDNYYAALSDALMSDDPEIEIVLNSVTVAEVLYRGDSRPTLRIRHEASTSPWLVAGMLKSAAVLNEVNILDASGDVDDE